MLWGIMNEHFKHPEVKGELLNISRLTSTRFLSIMLSETGHRSLELLFADFNSVTHFIRVSFFFYFVSLSLLLHFWVFGPDDILRIWILNFWRDFCYKLSEVDNVRIIEKCWFVYYSEFYLYFLINTSHFIISTNTPGLLFDL